MRATGVPLTSTTSPHAPGWNGGEEVEAARETIREEYFGGGRLLFSDARVMYLLANEARSRLIARLFGISGENSALVTVIALGLAADTVHRKMVKVLNAPGAPDVADAMVGASMLRESVRRIAGVGSEGSPMLGTLILGSLVAACIRPALKATLHAAKASSHRARVDFDHRYGHIIRPSHRRIQR
jgi:hypothetical protein